MSVNLDTETQALYAAIRAAITPLGLLDHKIKSEAHQPSRTEVIDVIERLHRGLAEAFATDGPQWALLRSARVGVPRAERKRERVDVESIRSAVRLQNSTTRERLKSAG